MVAYYANNENITNEERMHNIAMEFKSYDEDVKNIDSSVLQVCWYFHAAKDLKPEDSFTPGMCLIVCLQESSCQVWIPLDKLTSIQ